MKAVGDVTLRYRLNMRRCTFGKVGQERGIVLSRCCHAGLYMAIGFGDGASAGAITPLRGF